MDLEFQFGNYLEEVYAQLRNNLHIEQTLPAIEYILSKLSLSYVSYSYSDKTHIHVRVIRHTSIVTKILPFSIDVNNYRKQITHIHKYSSLGAAESYLTLNID